MKTIKINEDIRIPGVDVVLEKGDRILYEGKKLSETFTGDVAALMKALSKEGWDVDSSYEDYATFQMGNIFVTVYDDGRVTVRDAYEAKGIWIDTNVKNFAKDYGKIIKKYLKPRYDYGEYRFQAPYVLDLE